MCKPEEISITISGCEGGRFVLMGTTRNDESHCHRARKNGIKGEVILAEHLLGYNSTSFPRLRIIFEDFVFDI